MNSPTYFRYWGKARQGECAASMHLLPYHCLDVAAVGVAFLRKADGLRRFFKECLRIEADETLYAWMAFWLALHDLGKFAEAFQSQRDDLFRELRQRPPDPAKHYRTRHDSLGMLLWTDVLCDHAIEDEWFGPGGQQYAEGLDFWMRAVTGHHGQPPDERRELWSRHFDKHEDRQAVFDYVADLRELFIRSGVAPLVQCLPAETFRKISAELSWWLAGLVVLADWIGSNAEIFEYRANGDLSLAGYWTVACERAERALETAGVVSASRRAALGFNSLFPDVAQPSPLQTWAATVDLPVGPQIHLLEDVTGAGKTEAAVMLMHRLVANGSADGFFVGLPTMATANAMYGRLARVYAKLFDGFASLALAHRQHRLVEDFAASVVVPGVDETDAVHQADDTATARCAAWLADYNKRALLAPAGVGTIDQALLGALQSRHQSLRLLGLFRKVLVVDEVHACDAYMQSALEALLRIHARAGGSAILLSATLPQRMKASLLSAFAAGRREQALKPSASEYPLATSWFACAASTLVERPNETRKAVARRIAVQYESEKGRVVAAIDAALAAGRCVCWIRNTVADALAAYAEFSARMLAEKLTLFHARFALRDRLDIEERVLASFGPESGSDERHGRLLIASQVAEQSLDVDFDLVVSDLAPIDRLIQRAGRMHRHVRDATGNRLRDLDACDQRGEPRLLVFGPEWADQPLADWFKKSLPKAVSVYPNHGQLWLTVRALRAGYFDMPGDARVLIESVFGDAADVPEGLRANATRAEGSAYCDTSLAQLNSIKLESGYWRGGVDWLADGKVPSRLGEDTTEVFLARWVGDRLVPWADHPVARHAWAYSAVRVAQRLIAVAEDPTAPERRAARDAALAMLPGQGKWAVLLALEARSGYWGVRAAGGGAAAKKGFADWRYDSSVGLTLVQ